MIQGCPELPGNPRILSDKGVREAWMFHIFPQYLLTSLEDKGQSMVVLDHYAVFRHTSNETCNQRCNNLLKHNLSLYRFVCKLCELQ